MLIRFALRGLTELSPRLALKAAWLYAFKGLMAVRAYKKRLAKGELYPPFMFISLTNACNLRCHGCWVEKGGTAYNLTAADVDRLIATGKEHKAYFYTLLGGEPFMYEGFWDILTRHSDCYFQAITNGMFLTEENVGRIKKAGNLTPLVSLDGWKAQNDLRRGEGVFDAAAEGMKRLKKAGIFYGVASTATATNVQELMSDEYVRWLIGSGAMYVWYYVYRPMGAPPHPEYCLSKEQLIGMRKRLLELRRKQPILIIDSYWTANGVAFCPAALGLGYHIGPQGSIEICPALSFARERIGDNGGDLFKTINESRYLRGFTKFVTERTKGCVILERPQELHAYLQDSGAQDYSGRGTAFAELNALTPRSSQHLPGEEIPEDYWFYRFLKNQVFFGMGAYG
ncbi:MAG: radical SAM/SPASM domain-containing protein [Planctomycetota bacterium]|nr:radical SAM/SPASM domain-containing protein [Planctomycetota bacterium]